MSENTEKLAGGTKVYLRRGREHWVVVRQEGSQVVIYRHDGFSPRRKRVRRIDVRPV